MSSNTKLETLYSNIYKDLSKKGILYKDFYSSIYYKKIENAYLKQNITALEDAYKKTLLFYDGRDKDKDLYSSTKIEPLVYTKSDNVQENWANYQKALLTRFNKESDTPISREWYHDKITDYLNNNNDDLGEIEEILSYIETVSEFDEILGALESSRGIENLEKYNKRKAYNHRQISKDKEEQYKERCKEPKIKYMKETLYQVLVELHNTKPYKAKKIARLLNYL